MSTLPAGAGGFARCWVWLYTLGLAPGLREERRAEVASDLWEQRTAASLDRVPEARVALVTLARCLLGMPADLSWRAERSRAAGSPGALLGAALGALGVAERVADWLGRRGLPGLTILLGGLYALLGAIVILTIPVNGGADATPAGLFVFGLVCLSAATAILVGSRRLPERPWLSAGLILGGAGVMGLVLWATVVAPLATLLVGWSALRRARTGRRNGSDRRPAYEDPQRRVAKRKLSSYYARMLPRAVWIPPELIARLAEAVDGDPHGVRRAMLRGAQLGLLWGIVGRVWMRQIADEPMFSPVGTLLILIVVTGFGAAAGYAFAVRRRPWGRLRRWLHRFLALVPLLGMGPFVVFFLGNLVYAALPSPRGWRRFARWPLAIVGALVTGFWALVFISQNPDGQGWASALLYLALGYLLFVALRFALEPAGGRARADAGAVLEV